MGWKPRQSVYAQHGSSCRGQVVRVRGLLSGLILAGICTRCGAQTTAHEAVVWGVDR